MLCHQKLLVWINIYILEMIRIFSFSIFDSKQYKIINITKKLYIVTNINQNSLYYVIQGTKL